MNPALCTPQVSSIHPLVPWGTHFIWRPRNNCSGGTGCGVGWPVDDLGRCKGLCSSFSLGKWGWHSGKGRGGQITFENRRHNPLVGHKIYLIGHFQYLMKKYQCLAQGKGRFCLLTHASPALWFKMLLWPCSGGGQRLHARLRPGRQAGRGNHPGLEAGLSVPGLRGKRGIPDPTSLSPREGPCPRRRTAMA